MKVRPFLILKNRSEVKSNMTIRIPININNTHHACKNYSYKL